MKTAGTQQVSLESGWETVENFLEDLEYAVEKEKTEIRETEFSSPEKLVDLWVKTDRSRSIGKEEARVDRSGNIFLSPKWANRRIAAISYDGVNYKKVRSVEYRYDDEHVSEVVCKLREQS